MADSSAMLSPHHPTASSNQTPLEISPKMENARNAHNELLEDGSEMSWKNPVSKPSNVQLTGDAVMESALVNLDELDVSAGSDDFDGAANFVGGEPETVEGQLVMDAEDEQQDEGIVMAQPAANINISVGTADESVEQAQPTDAQIDSAMSRRISNYARVPSTNSMLSTASRSDSRNRSNSRQSLTVPKAPVFRSSSRSRGERVLSYEERQAAEAEEGARRLREMMHRNSETMQKHKIFAGQAAPSSIRSTKELTIPQSPRSLLSSRHGEKHYSCQGQEEEVEHDKSHNSSGSAEQRTMTLTAPQPFKFQTDKRASSRPSSAHKEAASEPTLGEQLHAYSHPRGDRSIDQPTVSDNHKPTLTRPVAPKLRTDSRLHRRTTSSGATDARQPVAVPQRRPSGTQMDATAHQAPARAPTPTQPRPFTFQTSKRSSSRPDSATSRNDEPSLAEQLHDFYYKSERGKTDGNHERVHSKQPTLTVPVAPKLTTHARARSVNQMPTDVAAADTANKPRRSATPVAVTRNGSATTAPDQPRRPTIAHAPRLHTADRPRSRPSSARSMQRPDSAASQRSASSNTGPKELTEVQPFQLATENRGQAHQIRMQRQIEAERRQAEEQTKVRARPVPNLARAYVPKPSEKEPTDFAEFQLTSAQRHEEYSAHLKSQLQQQELEAKQAAEFKARPIPRMVRRPSFEIRASDKELTQPADFQLASSNRAANRRSFDLKKELQAREREAAQQAELLEQQKQEADEIKALRTKTIEEGGMAFRARRVGEGVPVEVPRPSSARSLTEPQSPALQTGSRARLRNHD